MGDSWAHATSRLHGGNQRRQQDAEERIERPGRDRDAEHVVEEGAQRCESGDEHDVDRRQERRVGQHFAEPDVVLDHDHQDLVGVGDERTATPIHSLYGDTIASLKPTAARQTYVRI